MKEVKTIRVMVEFVIDVSEEDLFNDSTQTQFSNAMMNKLSKLQQEKILNSHIDSVELLCVRQIV